MEPHSQLRPATPVRTFLDVTRIGSKIRRLIGGERLSPESFRLACRHYNVLELIVDGAYGPMQGAASDQFIMREYMREGSFDSERVRFLRTSLGDGGSFLDIGANIGMYTVALAVNPKVRCIAFEPEPNNFRALENNVGRNCVHHNVICHRVAVMESPGEVLFELSPDNTGDHRVRISGRASGSHEGTNVITIAAERLDRLLAGAALPPPLIAKIDVQGAELSVLRAAGALLTSIDVMILELWPYGLRQMGATADALLGILREHFPFGGYTPWDRGIPPRITSFETMAAATRSLDPGKSDDFADLFLMRNEDPHEITKQA